MENLTHSSAEDKQLQAGSLFQLVEELGVRFACERSARFCRGRLLPNRYLLTVTKEAIRANADATIVALCRRMHMAKPMVGIVERDVAAAKFVHFGFEEDETGIVYKGYLE